MKTIGIKLADGSFYPVLEEGTPKQKNLELTTAHNNQTKVMVDLYRSATCSMEDAEYVDSLQIENLNAHPTGETEISFTVSLDEDNQLSANIIDEETGRESGTTITLVSRTLEERLVTDEYKLSDYGITPKKTGGLLAAANRLINADGIENEPGEPDIEETAVEDQSFSEFTLGDPDADKIEDEMPVEDVTPPADENSFISDDLPDFNLDNLEPTPVEDSSASDETLEENTELPDFGFDESESSEVTEENTELPDFNFDESESSEVTEENTELPDFNFDESESSEVTEENTELPDFSFDESESSEVTEENTELPDFSFDESESSEVTEENTELPDFSFDDFSPESTSTTEVLEEDTLNFNSGDFDIPDFGDISSATSLSEEDDLFSDNSNDDIPTGGGISFTGLYDKETELGDSANYDEEDPAKKTRVPVIICIICAIICVIATALILFIIPSKYNLLNKKADKKQATEIVQNEPEEEPEPIVEETYEEEEPESVPEAKEDEIVIVEKAEEVIPEQPPVVEEKPQDITYKIKWGDTLWDISDTYYKNPWRYKDIARFNKIKDPDYIISGTKITIPAE